MTKTASKVRNLRERIPAAVAGNPVVERITPERAEVWLRNQGPNRGIAQQRVDDYARDMARGHWQLNGETIKFDTGGLLIDGQHRLHAVVKAKATILSYVVRGLEPQVFNSIDIGIKRTAGQLFGIGGHENGNHLAAALAWLYRYRKGKMRAQSVRPTPDELFALLEKEPDIEASVPWATKMRRLGYPSLWVFAHYLIQQKDPVLAALFLDAVATGLNAKPGDATYVLRERLLENNTKRGQRLMPVDVYDLIIRAWNATRQGRVISKVQRTKSGNFDLPEPV